MIKRLKNPSTAKSIGKGYLQSKLGFVLKDPRTISLCLCDKQFYLNMTMLPGEQPGWRKVQQTGVRPSQTPLDRLMASRHHGDPFFEMRPMGTNLKVPSKMEPKGTNLKDLSKMGPMRANLKDPFKMGSFRFR